MFSPVLIAAAIVSKLVLVVFVATVSVTALKASPALALSRAYECKIEEDLTSN